MNHLPSDVQKWKAVSDQTKTREHGTLETFSKAPGFNKGDGGEENACIVHPEDSFPKDGILTPQLLNCELFNYLRSKKWELMGHRKGHLHWVCLSKAE